MTSYHYTIMLFIEIKNVNNNSFTRSLRLYKKFFYTEILFKNNVKMQQKKVYILKTLNE